MTTIAKILLCVTLLFFGCSSKQPIDAALSEDEYKIYSKIIVDRFPYKVAHRDSIYSPLVISEMTCAVDLFNKGMRLNYYTGDSKIHPLDTLKSLANSTEWDTLALNFKSVSNDTLIIVSARLAIPFKYYLNSTRPSGINKTYFIGFSRVGFSASMDEALVYFYYLEFEGSGEYVVLLRKSNSEWSIAEGYGVADYDRARYAYYYGYHSRVQ